MGTLESRVARLERSGRRWRLAGLTGWLAVAWLVFTGQDGLRVARVDELHTQRVVLEDAEGRRVGYLGVATDEATGLWFYDRHGRARSGLGTIEGRPFVAVSDERGNAYWGSPN